MNQQQAGSGKVAWLAWISVLLPALVLGLLYWFQPDWAAAITVFPAWLWSVVGLASLALWWRITSWRVALVGLLAWFAFSLICVDELPALYRTLTPVQAGASLRVATLNCAGGSLWAIHEALAVQPDILLLQESPGEEELRALALERDMQVVWGPDASVMARGQVEPLMQTGWESQYSAHCRVILPDGPRFEVISLRLSPAIFRFDLWNPLCWRDQLRSRRSHREQLDLPLDLPPTRPANVPLIIGGDFNVPARDAIFRLMPPDLRDAFRVAGRGWGDTIISDFPVHRIDAIWASSVLEPIDCRVVGIRYSDHRMVVADFALSSSAAK